MRPDPTPARFTPPSKRYAGYIFDCDGTLVESMPLHFRAWRQALAAHGASFEFSWQLFVSRAGLALADTALERNAQFEAALAPALVVEAQLAIYRTLLPSLTAIEPVVEFARQV